MMYNLNSYRAENELKQIQQMEDEIFKTAYEVSKLGFSNKDKIEKARLNKFIDSALLALGNETASFLNKTCPIYTELKLKAA